LEKSGIAVDYDLLGTQGYQIITLGDDIYIIGENDGLSYAVYDLLNRLVGLEVYTTMQKWLGMPCLRMPTCITAE
jgi:hypothetical protein